MLVFPDVLVTFQPLKPNVALDKIGDLPVSLIDCKQCVFNALVNVFNDVAPT